MSTVIPPTHRQQRLCHTERDPLSVNKHFTSTLPRCRPAYLRWWPALSFFPFGLLFLAWMAITAGPRLHSFTGTDESGEGCRRKGGGGGERTITHHQRGWMAFSIPSRATYTHNFRHQEWVSVAKLEDELYAPFLELMFPPLPSAGAGSTAAAAAARSPWVSQNHSLTHTNPSADRWHARPLSFQTGVCKQTYADQRHTKYSECNSILFWSCCFFLRNRKINK